MKIDHILYLSTLGKQRTWVCQITECDGQKRIWRAECQSQKTDKFHDDISKKVVMDEAFRQFQTEVTV